MANKVIVDFKCMPFRCTKNTEDFKMYACHLIDSEDDIKENSYGNYTLTGNFHELGIGVEYTVRAVETYNSTYKYSYSVINIERDVPNDIQSSRLFLDEILTSNQTNVLLSVYPDIIDKVMNNDLDDIDLSKTKGIKEYTFNVIKKKIFENFILSKMFREFDGLISFKVLKKLSAKYPSSKKIKQELSKDPYRCLCSLSRIGFKTADSIILEMERKSKELIIDGKAPILDFKEDLRTSIDRMKACIGYILEENETNGHTNMKLSKLKTECQKLTPKCMTNFKEAMKTYDEISISKNGTASLKYTYGREGYIAKLINDSIENPIVWDIDVDKYKETEDGSLTDEQFSLLTDIQKQTIHILKGFAGTGKTFVTQQLIKMLEANGKLYTIVAPTGKHNCPIY